MSAALVNPLTQDNEVKLHSFIHRWNNCENKTFYQVLKKLFSSLERCTLMYLTHEPEWLYSTLYFLPCGRVEDEKKNSFMAFSEAEF